MTMEEFSNELKSLGFWEMNDWFVDGSWLLRSQSGWLVDIKACKGKYTLGITGVLVDGAVTSSDPSKLLPFVKSFISAIESKPALTAELPTEIGDYECRIIGDTIIHETDVRYVNDRDATDGLCCFIAGSYWTQHDFRQARWRRK